MEMITIESPYLIFDICQKSIIAAITIVNGVKNPKKCICDDKLDVNPVIKSHIHQLIENGLKY
jgi:hypothetical protein